MFMTNASTGPANQVVSLRFLPDSRRLAALMRGGDITMISIDEDEMVRMVSTVQCF
jgi:elongator complex protein 1